MKIWAKFLCFIYGHPKPPTADCRCTRCGEEHHSIAIEYGDNDARWLSDIAASHNQEYHGEGEHKDPYCVRCGKTFRGE